jgi:hypothetical protein
MNNARNVASVLPPSRAEKARASLDRLDAYRAKVQLEQNTIIAPELQAISEPTLERREPPLEGLKRVATGAAFITIGVLSDAPNATLERALVITVGIIAAGWGALDLHQSACNPRSK